MPVAAWRVAAWFGIVLTLVSIAGDLAFRPALGSYGFSSHEVGFERSVDRVDPHSAAAAAGIVPGDRVALETPSLAYREHLNFNVIVSETLPLRVVHDGRERIVRLVARASPKRGGPFVLAYEMIRLVLIALAALIVVRRPDRADARALASFYILFAFGFLGAPPWFGEGVRVALFFLQPAGAIVGIACLCRFAAIFPAPSPSGFRHHVPRIAGALATIAVAFFAENAFAPIGLGFDPVERYDLAIPLTIALMGSVVGLFVCTAAAFAIGAREAEVSERGRLRWLALSFAVGFAGLIPAIVLESTGADGSWYYVLALTLVAIPIGSTYAILRQRVVDVGFVLNRAIVFAVVSAIVVLSFTVLEFFIGKYLVSFGHVQSTLLEAALAIGVALSLGRVHAYVNRLVDAIFFRERHLAERTLRRLAAEVVYLTDADLVASRVTHAVERHAGLSFAALYLIDAENVYRARSVVPASRAIASVIGDDDPAIVRLKTFREPVDFVELSREGAPSIVPAVNAFPLFVRGELLGLLVAGAKRNDEALAPDERATLATLALATGVALDSLRTTSLRRAVARALAGDGDLDALRDAATFALVPTTGDRAG